MIGVGTFKLAKNSRKYVNAVLDSERLSYGSFTQRFEEGFAAAHACRFAIMSNSGTSSLQVALAAMKSKYGWADGDEVIVPSVTFVATVNIVLQNALTPVIVDVDPVYYELDPEAFQKAITPKTRCVIPVHVFGCPCDMDPICAIAKEAGLAILEDSCESMFVQYKGKSVGSFGDVGCFSTYVAHILATGVGGLCTTSDPELAIKMRSLINHGRDSIYLSIDDDQGKSTEEQKLIIERRFRFTDVGYSYRITELEGALGLAEFECREELMRKRRENADYFNEKLSKFEDRIQLPSVRPESGHAFMMYPIVLRDLPKTEFVQFLEKNHVETRDLLPLVNQPVYDKLLNLKEDDYPVAKWINQNGFYIGCHQGLTENERDYVVDLFESYFGNKTSETKRSCLIVLSKIEPEVSDIQLEKAWEQFHETQFDEIIVVDASEHQKVSQLAQGKGVKCLHHVQGKGAGLLNAIDNTTADYIVVMGIDGTDSLDNAHDILTRLKRGSQMVLGSRFLMGGSRSAQRPFSSKSFGNRLFTLLLSIAFEKNITDSSNLQRGFRRDCFQKLSCSNDGEGIMFEMTLKALENDIVIDETPVVERVSVLPHEKRNRVLTGLLFLKTFLSWMLFRQKKHS